MIIDHRYDDFLTDIGKSITSAWNTLTGQPQAGSKRPFYNQEAAKAAPQTPDTSQHVLAIGMGSDNGGPIDQAANIANKAVLTLIGTVAPAVAAGYLAFDVVSRAIYKANAEAFIVEWMKRYGTPPAPEVIAALSGDGNTQTAAPMSPWKKVALGAGAGLVVGGPAGAVAGGGLTFLISVIADKLKGTT